MSVTCSRISGSSMSGDATAGVHASFRRLVSPNLSVRGASANRGRGANAPGSSGPTLQLGPSITILPLTADVSQAVPTLNGSCTGLQP